MPVRCRFPSRRFDRVLSLLVLHFVPAGPGMARRRGPTSV